MSVSTDPSTAVCGEPSSETSLPDELTSSPVVILSAKDLTVLGSRLDYYCDQLKALASICNNAAESCARFRAKNVPSSLTTPEIHSNTDFLQLIENGALRVEWATDAVRQAIGRLALYGFVDGALPPMPAPDVSVENVESYLRQNLGRLHNSPELSGRSMTTAYLSQRERAKRNSERERQMLQTTLQDSSPSVK